MLTVDSIERQLKTEELKNLYLLFGEETFLLETSLRKIKTKFGEAIKGINYISIDETNVGELISNLQTPAFGYNNKLIIARNTGLFKKEGKRKNAELSKIKEKINEYITENIKILEETTVMVFIEEDVDKRQKLFNTLDKNGIVCEFSYLKPIQIEKRIKTICDGYKVNIDNNTIKYFIECCGTNMQELINEIRKLIEYVGENGKIEKDDIDKLSIKKLESIIFDLTDNLGKKEISKSLEVLNNLIYAKEPIQKILITLYNHFKKIYFTTLALKYNKDIISSIDLKPNQTFLVNKYKMQSKYFKESELKDILQNLRDLDFKYKNGLIDLQIGLEAILCRYCS